MTESLEKLLRAGFEAAGKGDWDTGRELMPADLVYHHPIMGELSGDQFIEVTSAALATLDSFELEIHDILVTEKHAVVLTRDIARRGDEVLDMPIAHIFHYDRERMVPTEWWETPYDQAAYGAFWAASSSG